MSEWSDILVSSYVIKKGTDVMASQFVSYTVQASREGQKYTVERRFSEFVLLQKTIASEFPGAIIAPLPKDQVFGRFKPSFIESRMRGLEEFLKKTYSDPEMSKSICWSPFFTSLNFNEMALNEERSKVGTNASTHRRSSWLDTMKNMAAVQMAKPVVDTSDMDSVTKEITYYIETWTTSLLNVAKAAAKVRAKVEASADTLKSFSEVSSAMGCNAVDENEKYLHQFGLAVGSLSQHEFDLGHEYKIRVVEPLEHHSRSVESIKSTLQRQQDLKKKYVAAEAERVLSENQLQKDPSDLAKSSKNRKCREAVMEAKQAFLSTSRSIQDSFERLKHSRNDDMIAIMEALVDIEIVCCKKDADVLADIVEEMID